MTDSRNGYSEQNAKLETAAFNLLTVRDLSFIRGGRADSIFFYQVQFFYALPQFLAENAVTPQKTRSGLFEGLSCTETCCILKRKKTEILLGLNFAFDEQCSKKALFSDTDWSRDCME